MILRAIFISPGHNYFGHHGRPASGHATLSVPEVECVAGQGLRGDRFWGYKNDYKGQVTFFDEAVFADLRARFPRAEATSPGVLRRNLLVDGVDLNSLIGKEFELQGVRFAGMAECSPCYWMDQAFHPGTEEALKNRGGLRAKILNTGFLKIHATRAEGGTPPLRDPLSYL